MGNFYSVHIGDVEGRWLGSLWEGNMRLYGERKNDLLAMEQRSELEKKYN